LPIQFKIDPEFSCAAKKKAIAGESAAPGRFERGLDAALLFSAKKEMRQLWPNTTPHGRSAKSSRVASLSGF
jgi:hypothetical protein